MLAPASQRGWCYCPRGRIWARRACGTSCKKTKARRWINQDASTRPLAEWHGFSGSETEIALLIGHTEAEKAQPLILSQPRDHNSLNRLTGTTGTGDGFAPYQSEQTWYHPALELELELYACIDARLD